MQGLEAPAGDRRLLEELAKSGEAAVRLSHASGYRDAYLARLHWPQFRIEFHQNDQWEIRRAAPTDVDVARSFVGTPNSDSILAQLTEAVRTSETLAPHFGEFVWNDFQGMLMRPDLIALGMCSNAAVLIAGGMDRDEAARKVFDMWSVTVTQTHQEFTEEEYLRGISIDGGDEIQVGEWKLRAISKEVAGRLVTSHLQMFNPPGTRVEIIDAVLSFVHQREVTRDSSGSHSSSPPPSRPYSAKLLPSAIVMALHLLGPGRVALSERSVVAATGAGISFGGVGLSTQPPSPMEPRFRLRTDSAAELAALSKAAMALVTSGNPTARIVVSRFRSGCVETDPHERIIDHVIALEALLLPNTQDELSYKFANRAAYVLGTSTEERLREFSLARSVYGWRSQIVHGGQNRRGLKLRGEGVIAAERAAEITEDLARRILRRLLTLGLEGIIERREEFWNELVLSGSLGETGHVAGRES